jgi:hypothetical protein
MRTGRQIELTTVSNTENGKSRFGREQTLSNVQNRMEAEVKHFEQRFCDLSCLASDESPKRSGNSIVGHYGLITGLAILQ